MIRETIALSAAVFLLAFPSSAQTVVQTLHSSSGGAGFGAAVRTLGDVSGDGLPDVAVGQVGIYNQNPVSSIDVFRGGDGALLYHLPEPTPLSFFGAALARVGDLNGDGKPELLVGAPGNPANANAASFVRVISGSTGSLLLHLNGTVGSRFGAAVLGLTDVNNDGVADYAVGAPTQTTFTSNEGAFFVYSGQTGTLLYSVLGSALGEELGQSLAALPDQNSDGAPELLVGAPGLNRAYLYSGANGALLRTFIGPVGTSAFGFSVDGTADVDSDSLADVIIGAHAESGIEGNKSGAAYVYSNQSAALVYNFQGGFTNDHYGFAVRGVQDINHDGVGDFLIGATLSGSSSFFPAGFIQARSGATGASLFFVSGGMLAAEFGYAIDEVGDFDNDGLLDLIVGAPGRDFASIVRAEDPLGVFFCFGDGSGTTCPCGNNNDGSVAGGAAGCANGANPGGSRILATGSTSLAAANLQLHGSGLDPLRVGLYFQGTSAENGGLGSLLGDGLLCAGGSIIRMEIVSASATGSSQSSLNIGAVGGAQAGDIRFYQLWYRNPLTSPCSTGFNLTNAVELQWQL